MFFNVDSAQEINKCVLLRAEFVFFLTACLSIKWMKYLQRSALRPGGGFPVLTSQVSVRHLGTYCIHSQQSE